MRMVKRYRQECTGSTSDVLSHSRVTMVAIDCMFKDSKKDLECSQHKEAVNV
jgi:hypothetical protein